MFTVNNIVVFLIALNAINARLLDNINEAILSDLDDEYSALGLPRKELLDVFVKDILKLNKDDHDHESTDGEDKVYEVCSRSFNATRCGEFVKHNCIDIHTLLEIAVNDEQADSMNISDTFPLLMYHMYNPVCSSKERPEASIEKHNSKLSSAKVWGYGIGFVALICFISNVGGLMAPFMKHRYFQRILLFCVALAVGTLAATGFLVLLPESMHLTGKHSPIPNYHLKMTTVMGGLYFFYVSEKFLKFLFGRKGLIDLIRDISGSGRDYIFLLSSLNWCKKKRKTDSSEREDADILFGNEATDDSKTKKKKNGHGHSHFPAELNKEDESAELALDGQGKKSKKQVSTVAWMILIGDALHNFVDGISIGAAFTENTYLGISVSLAICCEELPHELGDIAILLHSGLSMKRALLYNFIAALTVGIGLILGILLGENTSANTWIFAAAGGMFIYISLVDMVPEMAEQAKHVIENKLVSARATLFIQNLGLLAGFTIIFMLVMYGGNIKV